MTNNELSLLIISGVRGDTRRYRTFHLYEQSQLADMNSQLAHITDHDLQKKVEQASLIILHRTFYTDQVSWLINYIHRKGGLVIQDIDDLLFEPAAFSYIDSVDFADPLRTSLYIEEMHLYRNTIEACDAVIVSTDYLAERAKQFNKPVRVHRNAYSMEMLSQSEKAFKSRRGMDERIVIGYASGTATHNQDFARIKPALQSIMQKFANAELWLVGPLDPGKDWGRLADRIHQIKKVPWRELPEVLAKFDINLAPIRIDNPFGQSKSEIKFMEAALVKVPTIANPSDAFKVAIRHQFNGFLANSTREWEQTLEQLIFERKRRLEVGNIAYQDVIQSYHPLVRAKELAVTLSSLTNVPFDFTPSVNPEDIERFNASHTFWSSAPLENTPTLRQMGLYTLHTRGFRTLLKQIRVYIRRWLTLVFPYQKTL
jgi:glycosyltransferase involved in cell wall biosynthesis